jgi:MFS family permease
MAGQGLANALLSTTGSIVVAGESPAERRGESIALYYVASSVGVAIGPAVGFALAATGGIVLNLTVVTVLALVVVALVVALRTLPGNPAAPAGLGPPWSRPAVPASLALVVITLGAATVYAFLPLHADAAGLGHVPWFFPLMSGGTIACRLLLRRASDRFGRVRVLVPALVATTLGQLVLALPPTVPTLVLAAALLGCGNSMLYPTLVALIVDRTPAIERGRAIGTLSAAWDVGLTIGSPLIALLVDTHGFPAGFLASALAAAAGLALLLALERRRRPPLCP